jgi:hypothetical protein
MIHSLIKTEETQHQNNNNKRMFLSDFLWNCFAREENF